MRMISPQKNRGTPSYYTRPRALFSSLQKTKSLPATFRTPEVLQALYGALGEDLMAYVVGSGEAKRNPTSGLEAFADDEASLEREIQKELRGYRGKSADEQREIKKLILRLRKLNFSKGMSYLGSIGNAQENPGQEYAMQGDDELKRQYQSFDNASGILADIGGVSALAAPFLGPKGAAVASGVGIGTYAGSKIADDNADKRASEMNRRHPTTRWRDR